MGDDRHGTLVGAGVSSNIGRESRPSSPPGGFAQCSVGSTGSRCGRWFPFTSTSSLIHLTRTGRFHLASIVSEGALWTRSPFFFAEVTAP